MINIQINSQTCIHCGHCADVCPAKIMVQKQASGSISIINIDTCIVCGQCAAICPTNAVVHNKFPLVTLHKVDQNDLPTPESLELLIKNRRSNRVFSSKPIPRDKLMRIIEAAHRAPTATNAQKISFTLVTSPKKINEITEFTLNTFGEALKKLKNPLLKPFLKRAMPEALHYVPVFEELIENYKQGQDGILRGATTLLFINAPRGSRFGSIDANLAYQNASLLAESLGIAQFYCGYVLSAAEQHKKKELSRILGIQEEVFAIMALGVPKYRFTKYMDRKPIVFNEI